MIGSFWNLCRACPSMPVDKVSQLHSEYRSTYRWHEFTGNSRPEVVRRAPAPNPSQFIASLTGPTNEPPLPRRKKCPELAYKSHEFIIGSEYTDARGGHAGANRSARSEERGTPSRRSKSEGPPAVPNGRAYAIPEEVDGPAKKQAGESSGLFKKTISKLSTEYRLQFVWPNVRRIKGIEAGDAADHPRKSISMGALKANQQQQQQQHLRQHPQPAMPTVHKKRTTNQKEATLHELEPLVSDAEESKPQEKQVTIVEKVERKTTIRPFSQTFDQERTNHFITKKENFGFDEMKRGDTVDNKQQPQQLEQEVLLNGTAPPRSQPNLDLWFKEVVELRKKAGEYKCRGWGIEIDPELYKKQKDLWEQVSKRSSLSALSLASSVHRPITKEEKEQENNKKSIPLSKATQKTRVPGQAHLLDNKDEISALPARFSNIRHHLERTTGPDVEEGALLPSPTREKLMPAITKRESESQRGSPKKTAASRHGSPQKGSPQKGSPKKVIKTRSQSVGPAEHVSPKRQLRSASTAPSARLTAGKKTPVVPHHATSAGTAASGTGAVERKPRPSTLSTTLHSRTKSSSLPPPSGRAHSVSAAAATTTTTTTTAAKQSHPNYLQQTAKSTHEPNRHPKSNPLCKNFTQTAYGMPLLRKKDKDKTNLINLGTGKASDGRTVKARPKSTGAAMNVTASSGGKPARPISLTEATLLPTKATTATTVKATAAKFATEAARTELPTKPLVKELKSGVENKTATTITKDQVISVETQPKPKETALPSKAIDPMMASVFGALPDLSKDTSNLMTTSVYGQLGGSRVTADPMLTSVFGQLPAGEVAADGAALNIAVGGSGCGGGDDVGVGMVVGAGGGGGVDVAALKTVEPVMAKNLTLTGLTVPYTRDHKKSGENDAEDGRDTAISVSSCSPQPAPEIPDEPIVKSPPEPTRVKSPEQILMRSPDPVNWTVPLDTGKTFTVTQNVKEGENYSRPQSEIKASTPVEKPPPPPQSAPPQLTEQAKMDGKP
ncbi:uncharacterized protein LOC105218641 isoform X1 [Zeugodacus cucurbitae]|uniref:uncharacterized protein LOC105218641 isoform X1 n=1 Tax=Zeugodacus cucurbitae TaxID=28588 RepID=UPI0023D964BD|nr:uncharacterized protein LOC105218641 isoform X1 [Zeugodacus cucurbitae]